MDEFYLYLYCGDSLKTQVDNHAGNFVVDLPKTYQMPGDWECALTELSTPTLTEEPSNRLYICTDIVEESHVRNSFLPVLRSIGSREEYFDLDFVRPYYFKVRFEDMNRLRMFIRGDDLQPLRFKVDHLYCTLHFRKRRWGP